MRILFTVVGTGTPEPEVWADLDAVPQKGEKVSLPGISEVDTVVRSIVWHPLGELDGAEGGPFVHLVLGQRRR